MLSDDASQVELLQALLRLFDPLEWQKQPTSIRDQFAAFDAARRAERDAALLIVHRESSQSRK
tara:strand:- start:1016 stop:1204 length:189 start_codon:yes stop_codon:yes gene_type:complete